MCGRTRFPLRKQRERRRARLSRFSRTSGPCRPKSAGTARPLAKKLGLLVYGGAFIAEDMGVLRIFRSKVERASACDS
jgi:hypothetical protein